MIAFPRIVHRARRTYWEVAHGVFQATETPEHMPTGAAGYPDLSALCALKGDHDPREFMRGFREAQASGAFDPPHGSQEARDEYRAGFNTGHDKVCADRAAGRVSKRFY